MEFVSSRCCKHSEAMVIWFVDYVIPLSPALLLLCYYWTNQVWGLSVSSERPALKCDRIGGGGDGAVKTSGMRDVLPHAPNIPYANPVWLLYMYLSCGFISQFSLEPGLHANSHLHSTRSSPFLWCQSLEFFSALGAAIQRLLCLQEPVTWHPKSLSSHPVRMIGKASSFLELWVLTVEIAAEIWQKSPGPTDQVAL